MTLTGAQIETLARVDTPTVCNAIELAQGKRGFDAFTRGTPVASQPDAPAIFGRARTARICSVAPLDGRSDADNRRIRRDYYRYMADGDGPRVAVVEDLDGTAATGAWWGEINATLHKAFGLSGALTNGVIRDLGDMPADFPVIGGQVGPSHGFVHVIDTGTPVTVFGLSVAPGDFVHADRHGAVVVPEDVLPALAEAIDRMVAAERIVLDAATAPEFDMEMFEKAWARFEAARV